MENRRGDVSEHESACARVAAGFPQRWLRAYAGSKLRRDPIFPEAYELLRASAQPILDVGCGVGLLASYLRERGCRQPILGLDVDARKIRQARSIIAPRYQDVRFSEQDVQQSIPAFSGNIALFDVLHYLPPSAQSFLLARLAERVAPGGALIIRDCLRDNGPRFWMTFMAEKFAQTISWNLNTALDFPTRERINEVFDEKDFERQTRPLWARSPFNNYIFIFRRRAFP